MSARASMGEAKRLLYQAAAVARVLGVAADAAATQGGDVFEAANVVHDLILRATDELDEADGTNAPAGKRAR